MSQVFGSRMQTLPMHFASSAPRCESMLSQMGISDRQTPTCGIGVLGVSGTIGGCMSVWVLGFFNDIIIIGLEIHWHASD
jgi:hypothetical protein